MDLNNKYIIHSLSVNNNDYFIEIKNEIEEYNICLYKLEHYNTIKTLCCNQKNT